MSYEGDMHWLDTHPIEVIEAAEFVRLHPNWWPLTYEELCDEQTK